MNIIDIVKSLISPSKKKTSQDTQEFVDDLWRIKQIFPEDQNLEDLEDWEDLWMYIQGIRKEKIWKHQACRDPFGWYRRSYLLWRSGWELKELGDDYYTTPEETLIDVIMYKNSIYEYFY